LTLPEQAL